ncbi:MAG TPA: SCP2 sterol-binding domain-containing protein [Acidimicrobiales bacterium]
MLIGSEEWVAAVLLPHVGAPAPPVDEAEEDEEEQQKDDIVVEHRRPPEEGERSEVVWHVGVRQGEVVAGSGPAPSPDVVITYTRGVVNALADGSLELQTALAEGRVKVSGSARSLRDHRRVLEALSNDVPTG